MEKHVMEERRHPDDSGERTIRIVDIARMAGVSTATVSRVFSHDPKVISSEKQINMERMDS